MKKKRKPWDRRKQPFVRALMEIMKKHGLSMGSPEGLAIAINWDCQNDPEQREQWFNSNKLDHARFYYDQVQNWLNAPENTGFVTMVFLEMRELYEYYENQSQAVH